MASGRDWLADPVVVATSEASKQARRAWMKMAPPENWLLRDLDPIHLAALLRMLETDASYRAAKAAAHASVTSTAMSPSDHSLHSEDATHEQVA